MSEFTPLREAVDTLANRALPPDFGELKRRATRRGRRRIALAVAGTAAVLVTAGIAGNVLPGEDRATPPAQPSPTETQSPSPLNEWTPERFRAEGTPKVLIPETTSGLAATEYLACEGTCEGELSNRALEVSQDGQSALFEVRGLGVSFVPVSVQVFDEDSVLVQDAKDGSPDGPTRYRLLQADGTAVELRIDEDPVPGCPRTKRVPVRLRTPPGAEALRP